MNFAFFALAFCAGAAIATQANINGQLAVGVAGNTIVAALISFVVGMLALAMIALLRGGLPVALAALPSQPLWKFAGGFLGAGFIFSTAFLAPRIGLTNLLALVIAGQLLTSITIDHFGLLGSALRPVSPMKLCGIIFLLTGVALTLLGEKLVDMMSRTS
jgi:transporter family-2 protein